jgi:cell division protease FtsH
LIEVQFERIAQFVQQQFEWNIQFDSSVTDVIYAEGVFPSQGTRPIFTTIKNLIESRISKMAVMLLEENLPVKNIRWYYEQQHFYFELRDEQNQFIKTISDEAVLKLENLRKSCDPEIQAHTAVHEAGHAVLAVATLHIIPALIVSRTASDSAEGFCQINFPKGPVTRETLRKDIIITLGGYIAEKLVFGEPFTSTGVYADIEEASSLANKAVRNYAMGKDPIHMAIKTTNNDDVFLVNQKYEVEALELIKVCEVEAMQLMKRNKLLLLKLSEYLTSHSRMEETQIEEFVVKYGAEEWMNQAAFVKKENYYAFNTMLQKQLKQFETSAVDELLQEWFELQV